MLVSHRVACGTQIGRSHRKNQDTGGAWTWFAGNGAPVSLAIVADGVSSGSNSEVASRLVVTAIHSLVSKWVSEAESDLDTLLQSIVETAQVSSDEIASGVNTQDASSSATTLAAAVCVGREVVGVWCGDSRVYLISASGASRLTRDHSWAEGVVSHGLMTTDQAALDPRAHMITRWLGPQESSPPIVDTFRLCLQDGDTILICSDGLYMYFAPPDGQEDELALAFRMNINPQESLDGVIATALDRGGHDDITGAVINLLKSE